MHHVSCGIMGPKRAHTAMSSWLMQKRKEDRRTGLVPKKRPVSTDLQGAVAQKKPAAAAAFVATLESWHRIGLLRTHQVIMTKCTYAPTPATPQNECSPEVLAELLKSLRALSEGTSSTDPLAVPEDLPELACRVRVLGRSCLGKATW